MSNQGYQVPRFRDIAVAPLTFVVVMGLLCLLSGIVKRVGDVFLYIPSKLGVVQRVAPAEITKIDLTTPSPALVEFTDPGKYAVFTGDTALLEANALYGEDATWLVIKSHTTGEPIQIGSVERGLTPYDTPLADGRPIFDFEITAPGQYEVVYSYRQASIAIVPDYTTGKETVIWLAYVVEVAVLMILLGLINYPRYRRSRQTIRSIQATQRHRLTKMEAFLDAQREEDREKTQDEE